MYDKPVIYDRPVLWKPCAFKIWNTPLVKFHEMHGRLARKLRGLWIQNALIAPYWAVEGNA
ncbi:hypothetical protein BFC18_04870 [Alteromonas confluentis]|uniref:Uncharacterized protein n=1 Tax=Alteromonas confluentis TaxID=1656094 RepID=A0A1E7ZET1_9ALTE|nr:hypothetical protein BFC18_04870 [Alteromonas confluentis]